jgi:PKD repeat protein
MKRLGALLATAHLLLAACLLLAAGTAFAEPADEPVAVAGGPYATNVGVPIGFDGSSSFDPEGGALFYAWDFGDGSTDTGPTPTHTYVDPGDFTVTLTVTDEELLSAADGSAAHVNAGPAADAGGPYASNVGNEIQFDGTGSSDPEDDPLTYSWDFGDGEIGSGPTPSHTYASGGQFVVTLQVTDPGDLSGDDTAQTTVNVGPTAEANGPYSGEAGGPIDFSSAGSSDPEDDPLTYLWDFGDGSSSTEANPSHTYAAGGSFTATLRVTDPGDLFDEDTASVTVTQNQPPTAQANGPYSGNVGDPISFSSAGSDDPDGDPLTYRWDFGDGSTSTQANPSHAYATGGPFTATLRVTDPDDLFDEDTAQVTVNRPPTADANGPYSGEVGDPIAFSSAGSDDPDGDQLTYRWDFGDGSTSTQANPSHSYASNGTFSATLRVTDPDDLFDEDTAQVTVTQNLPPTAEANGPYSGNQGASISFSSAGSSDPEGGPLTYRWDFGDGSTSTQANPSHTYATGGSFTATLRVTDPETLFDEDTAQVTVNRPPVADANGPYSGDVGDPIAFSAAGTSDPDGGPLTYRWDFGDGSTSTQANPSHSYASNGVFFATLRVTDNGGLFDEDTASVSVTQNLPPTAEANGPYSGNQGASISFSSAGSSDPEGGPLTFRWDFGDGTTSTQANPSHAYATGGSFTATLRVTDPENLFDEDTAQVTVNRPPVAEANGPYSGDVGDPIAFSAAGTSDPDGGPLTYRWDFGDGSTSTQANPSHSYASNGVFFATLRVTDNGGLFDEDTASVSVTQNLPPTAEANGPYSGNQGASISFSAAGSSDPEGGPLTYRWDFGDGTTSTQANPSHAYVTGGSFTATLRVTDPETLFDEDTAQVTVNRPPVAEANGPYSGDVGDPIAFSAAGTSDPDGGPLTYRWDFGDGTTSTQANPSHSYASSGGFTATLRVTDNGGLFDEDQASVSVSQNLPPTAEANGPYSGNPGALISFSSAGSSDPEGGPLTYRWDFGDGSTSTQANPTHAYAAGGVYTATLRVTDPDNLFDEDTATVNVNRAPTAEANGPYSGNPNGAISFSSAGSSDPDGQTLTYLWNFGDGSTSTQANPQHAYVAGGVFTATLRVTDTGGLFDEDTATVNVNRTPTAEANGPYNAGIGSPITFSSAGSSDPDAGQVLTYLWNFGDGTSSTQANPTHSYAAGGGFTATLRVTDPGGLFDEDTAQVTINRAPTAEANGPYAGNIGANITFSSAGSSDPDDQILTYLWNFGDGTTSTLANPTHSYATGGAFTATLRVTDPDNLFDEDTASVSVNRPPTAEANGPYAGNPGLPITFSSAGSTDPDGNVLTYLWSFGDGATSTLANPSHSYAAGGPFTATLRVTDTGGLFDEDTAQVVLNGGPTAEANGPYAGNQGAAINFSSAGSSDPDGQTLTYLWSFGDGASSTLANPTHTYATGGQITVTLRVTDPGGLFDEDTAVANVNRPPVADAGLALYNGDRGVAISFNGSSSSDPEGQTLTYLWTFGDGATSTLANPTHAYAVGGAYTATLRVTDPGGLFSEQTAGVLVQDIVVTFPTTATSRSEGDTLSVRWNALGGVSRVLIEFRPRPADPWQLVTGDVSAAAGQFNWRLPDIGILDATSAAFRVQRTSGAPLFDESDPFTVRNRTFVISSPAGGERIFETTTFGIAWTTTGYAPLVRLEYRLSPSNSWLEIVRGLPNIGSYTWTVPEVTEDKDQVQIRVLDHADPLSTAIPSAVFTIADRGLAVAAPLAGAVWSEGSTQQIQWLVDGPIGDVAVEWRRRPADLWTTIATQPASALSYGWLVPAVAANEIRAQVRIRETAVVADPTTTTSAEFTIQNRSILVTQPAAGDSISEHHEALIQWSSIGRIDTVRIEFHRRPSDPWEMVVARTPNDGEFLWTNTPDVTADEPEGEIRITDVSVTADLAQDTSAPFLFVNRVLVTSLPAPGSSECEADTVALVWDSHGYVPTVDIDWRPTTSSLWTRALSDLPNIGSATWQTPDLPAEGQIELRVRQSADPTVEGLWGAFTLRNRSLVLLRPEGGAAYSEGDAVPITWTSDCLDSVRVEARRRPADPWELQGRGVYLDNGQIIWSVIRVDQEETQVQVRVSDAADPATVFGESAPFTVHNRILDITRPTVTDSVSETQSVDVHWDWVGTLQRISIEYRLAPADPWTPIAGNLVNTGTYAWTVPLVDQDFRDAQLRVYDSNNTAVFDESDLFIVLNRALLLQHPAGGEVLTEAAEDTVRWETRGLVPEVTVSFRPNAAAPWQPLATAIPNTSQFAWVLPDVTGNLPAAQVKVEHATDATIVAQSAPFQIIDRTFTVLAPAGGERWSEATTHLLQWSSAVGIDSVRIDLLASDGTPLQEIFASTPNDGEELWLVPEITATLEDVSVRIADVRPPLAGARSATFTLEDRAITLDSPAPTPRVAWLIGSRQEVRWTTTGAIDSVAVELGRTGAGGPFEVLSPGLANSSGGSYSWVVTEPESFDAVVRVRDLHSAQVVGVTPFAVYLYDLVPPEECADFDDSGNVSLDELLLVEEIVVGETAASQADSLAADGTRDGRIDVRDLLCGADDMLAAERDGRGRPFADAGAEAAAARGATISLGEATGAVPVLIDARSAVAGVLLELDVSGGRAEATLGPDAGDGRLDRVESRDGRLVLVLRRGTKGDWPAGELVPLTIQVQPGGGGEVAIAIRRAEVIAADLTRLPVHLAGSAAQLVPARVALGVNRPNPFNPSTVIPFELPVAGQVTLEIYDVRGRLVRRLVNGQLPAGFHSATWDGRDHSGRGVASGLYLSMLRAGGETITRKLTLLR